jgi:hypothetical protein
MSSKTLCLLIRLCVIAAAVGVLFIVLGVIPSLGQVFAEEYPEFAHWLWPLLVLIWLSALPCFAVLVCVWKVSCAVKNDTVFTIQTARWIKAGGLLLLADAMFFFIGNILLFALKMNHPLVLLLAVLVDVFAITLALWAAVLSRYLTKAADLQEISDGIV